MLYGPVLPAVIACNSGFSFGQQNVRNFFLENRIASVLECLKVSALLFSSVSRPWISQRAD